jgi:TP901 family phage tail tape measure protein
VAFDAGELVATIRGDRTQLTRDLAAARTDLGATGKAADALAAKTVAAGNKAAGGARIVSEAAKDAAKSTTAAGTAAQQAGAKAAAANEKTATSARAAGEAAAQAGGKQRTAAQEAAAAQKSAKEQTEKNAAAQEKLGVGLTAYGAAALGAFSIALNASTQFGAKMAQLQTLSGANERQMGLESEAALTLGTAYGFTATQVADAEIELQKAGIGVTAQLNGGLKGALVGAAAGQMDVAAATSIGVTALTQFRLGADQTEHVMDLLAAGSDKALGSMDDLGQALKQGGLVASQMGLSVEDTTGTLAAFAQAGLIGSDAGTSLKTMLLSLQSPSQQAAAELKRYNITAYDSQGAFVGITNLAGQLKTNLSGVSQAQRDAALSTIFGSDAIRSANVLYNQGSDGLTDWISKVNDSGFAAEQAAGKQNSLQGSTQKLAAAIQTDLIRAGTAITPAIRPVVDVLGGFATTLGEIPAPILGVTTGVVGLTGAVSLGAGAFALFLPRILATRAALVTASAAPGTLGRAARGATAGINGLKAAGSGAASFFGGPWGLALAIAGAALAAWNMAIDAAKAKPEELDAAAAKGAAGLDLLSSAAARGQNVQRGWAQWIETAGKSADVEAGSLDNLSSKLAQIEANENPFVGFFQGNAQLGATNQTLKTIGETLARVSGTDAPSAAKSFEEIARKTDGSDASLRRLLNTMPDYRDALATQATELGHLTGKESESERAKILLAQANENATSSGKEQASAAEEQASSIAAIQGSASSASDAVSDLAKQIKGLGSTTADQRSAERSFQAAIDDASKALQDNGRGLDATTEKGRKNADALDKIASTGKDVASAMLANGRSAEDVAGKISATRAAYIKQARAMGDSKAEAEKLADKMGLIPTNVELLITANDSDAQAKIAAAKAAAREVERERYVLSVDIEIANLGAALRKAGVPNGAQVQKNARLNAYAMGGRIPGVDRGVDSEVIVARPGEHMLTVDDVSAMGGHSAVYGFRKALHGYAKGGAIGDASSRVNAENAAQARLQEQIDRQERAVKTARARAKKADAAAEKSQDASNGIYGKGTGDAKHNAVQRTRDLKKRAEAAAKAQKSAEDKLAKLRDDLTKSQGKESDQRDRGAALGQTNEDLAIATERGTYVDAGNPLGAADYGLQASRDQNLSASQRKALDKVSRKQGGILAGLAKQATDAGLGVDKASTALDSAKSATDAAVEAYHHQKTAVESATDAVNDATTAQQNASSSLENLRSQFSSVVSSVASNVRSLFSLGNAVREDETKTTSITHNAGTGAAWDEMVTSVNPGGATVASIRSEIDQKSATFASFAAQLQGLANMGYSSDVVTDVANLGADAGAKVAAALLTAGSGDVAAINSGYSSIASSTTAAGNVVAHGQLDGQISDAQRALDDATSNLQRAQQALTVAQDAEIAKLQAAQAQAQTAYNAALAVQASINAQITTAQQSIVTAVQQALTGSPSRKAYGGIVEAYAYGGVRPGAHFVPDGANAILYGEPGTGGEAFIPLAPDRRTRALAVLDETARRLGRVVVPAGAQGYALGGIAGSSSTSTSYGGDTHNWNGPILGDPAHIMAVAERRAAAKRARANTANRIGRVNP